MSIEVRRRPLPHSAEHLSAWFAARPDAVLLESGRGFGGEGRWSLFTAEPRLVFATTDDAWTLQGAGVDERGGSGALDRLARLAAELRLADPRDAPTDPAPFQGGLVGHFGYDLAPLIERLPRKAPRVSNLPDARFGLHDVFVLVDETTGAAELHAVDLLDEGADALDRRLEEWRDRLDERVAPPNPPRLGPILPDVERSEHERAVARTIEYIAAGDIFQANLSQRFTARSRSEIDPAWVHSRLRSASPAPYSALLRFGGSAVVSASPELFYRTEGNRVVTRPIKGTRPRGADPDDDRRLADELRNSLKDRAELTMIVDLERNDLGRVCEYGSVRVLDPMAIESFAQVHHLVATVEGRLRSDVGPIDVIRAVFPGGSITGAPKIRAMEIIDELEQNRRSAYTGSIGYLSRGGRSAFNIAIRTVLVEGDRLSFQVGGGIVADSTPADEYRETLHKAAGIRAALGPALSAED